MRLSHQARGLPLTTHTWMVRSKKILSHPYIVKQIYFGWNIFYHKCLCFVCLLQKFGFHVYISDHTCSHWPTSTLRRRSICCRHEEEGSAFDILTFYLIFCNRLKQERVVSNSNLLKSTYLECRRILCRITLWQHINDTLIAYMIWRQTYEYNELYVKKHYVCESLLFLFNSKKRYTNATKHEKWRRYDNIKEKRHALIRRRKRHNIPWKLVKCLFSTAIFARTLQKL